MKHILLIALMLWGGEVKAQKDSTLTIRIIGDTATMHGKINTFYFQDSFYRDKKYKDILHPDYIAVCYKDGIIRVISAKSLIHTYRKEDRWTKPYNEKWEITGAPKQELDNVTALIYYSEKGEIRFIRTMCKPIGKPKMGNKTFK